jgi:hypothetical protein
LSVVGLHSSSKRITTLNFLFAGIAPFVDKEILDDIIPEPKRVVFTISSPNA